MTMEHGETECIRDCIWLRLLNFCGEEACLGGVWTINRGCESVMDIEELCEQLYTSLLVSGSWSSPKS